MDWKALYSLFDHRKRLEADELDLFVERPGSVAADIVTGIELEMDQNGKWIVCGSMGSGKSTELVKLADMLKDTHAVVGIDLGATARVDQLSAAEVIFAIGAAVLRAARDVWEIEIDPDKTNNLVNAFKGLCKEPHKINVSDLLQGIAIFTANVFAPGSAKVAEGLAKAAGGAFGNSSTGFDRGYSLGGLTRETREGEPDLADLRQAVNSILSEFGEFRPPVILVDGLDKMLEIGAIRSLFATSDLLASPHCALVYSGPITLMLATEWKGAANFFQPVRLTNLVVTSDNADANPGSRKLTEMVERRLEREGLSLEQVFDKAALAALIEHSGGILRDAVHLVNRAIWQCVRTKAAKIDMDIAQAAIDDIRKELEVTLTKKRLDELREVERNKMPSGNDDTSHDLLLWNYVVSYSNGSVWFEPHPLLRKFLTAT